MAKVTSTDTSRRAMQKLKAEGGKRITIDLDKVAYQALTEIMAINNKMTMSDVVRHLILFGWSKMDDIQIFDQ